MIGAGPHVVEHVDDVGVTSGVALGELQAYDAEPVAAPELSVTLNVPPNGVYVVVDVVTEQALVSGATHEYDDGADVQ